MDDNRLHLDTPLLSFRRGIVPVPDEEIASRRIIQHGGCHLFNSDMKSGPVGIPGMVPFFWEKAPGYPKEISLATNAVEVKENGVGWVRGSLTLPESELVVGTLTSGKGLMRSHNEDDAFSDARDAFSLNCSTSYGDSAMDPFTRFTKDLETKTFMMDRFLPAAQAMTTDCPHRAWRKPVRVPVVEEEYSGRKKVMLKSFLPNYDYNICKSAFPFPDIDQDKEEDEEDDDCNSYTDAGFFSSKACRLIQKLCLKNSVSPLNFIPCLKTQGRLQRRTHISSPSINALQHASLEKSMHEDSWDAVYMHKLNGGYHPHRRDVSNLTPESNQHSSWTDSQRIDSSSLLNSIGSAPSPEKHQDSKSWNTESIGFCEKDNESDRQPPLRHLRSQWLRSVSSPETPTTILASANSPSDAEAMKKSSWECFSVGKESFFNENSVEIEDKESYGLNYGLALMEKSDASLALSVFPPPLPESPSESWLRRTLPAVASKGQIQRPLLDGQLRSSRKILRAHDDSRKR